MWERLYRLRSGIPRLRSKLRALYVIALLLSGRPGEQSILWGAGLVLLGAGLHFVSSGFLAKNETLVTRGPYRWVRNPFYLANAVVDVGLALAAWTWIVPAVYLPLMYFVIIPVRVLGHEEPDLRRLFGAEYAAYCRAVPRFLPHPFARRVPGGGTFSRQNLLENREISRFINAALLPLLFYLAWRLRLHGWRPLDAIHETGTLLLLASGAALYVIAILFYLKKRASRKNLRTAHEGEVLRP